MIDWIKDRLLHFRTDGRAITSDFVAARQKKAALLRRAVHICFYSQCALAVLCMIISCAANAMPIFAIIASLAVIAVAFFALGGGATERTVSYILDLVYAVICFIIGGSAYIACGVFMLMAAVCAFIGFTAWYFRGFLLEYSPLKITEKHYTVIRYALLELEHKEQEAPQEPPPPPPPPPKSDMQVLAEGLQAVMKAKPHETE